ncbi:hypothetical protein [Paraurantiacibacter namhicola]|uniref:Uncharacterized protein n=1 Tax=Paraurantiacibacter namhicola TaxID=645517 RepID=A0A1C7D7U5_9SPHN|nr:hypothetical protein [Paraurantiacibacter namhicola]ANU07518.1 hypothetical protein A6F65_01211 [Paraurantiacibacter namhicola]
MRKLLIGLVVLALIAFAAWRLWGGVEDYGAARIEEELVSRGVPQPVAACMGERMASRLSPLQLRKLERLRPQDGETQIPASMGELMTRIRRIDDPEMVEVTISSAATCAFSAG